MGEQQEPLQRELTLLPAQTSVACQLELLTSSRDVSDEEDTSEHTLVYLMLPQFLALFIPYDPDAGLFELRPEVNGSHKLGTKRST